MEIKGAAREYDVPTITLELAIASGALRSIDVKGQPKLLRPDVELFVKRTVKRGAGNQVITRLIPVKEGEKVAESNQSENSASGNTQ